MPEFDPQFDFPTFLESGLDANQTHQQSLPLATLPPLPPLGICALLRPGDRIDPKSINFSALKLNAAHKGGKKRGKKSAEL